MKKILKSIPLLLLLGCGEKEGVKSTKKELKNEKVVTITYARGEESSATDEIIEAFEKENPNIKVELFTMSGTSDDKHDKYITMFNMSKTKIDVFNADVVWVAEFAESNYILQLDGYIEKDMPDWEKFTKGAIQTVTYKNSIWAITENVDTGILFYRKDIIDTPPTTWEELESMSKKYVSEGIIDYGFTFQAKKYEGLVCNALEYIRSYGGEILDDELNVVVNSAETRKGLQKFVDIVNSSYVPKNSTIYTENESGNDFLTGKSLFHRNWPYIWSLSKNSDIAGKVGIAPLPKGDFNSVATIGGWVGAINRKSNNPEESWKFLKYMAGEKGQKIRALKGGLVPAFNPIFDDLEVVEKNNHFANKGFKDAINSGVPRPKMARYTELSAIIQKEVSKALLKEQSVDEAVLNMEKEIKKLIK